MSGGSGGAGSEAELDRLGRAVLGAASEAIVFTDREGVIRFWNPGAERLFGFAAEEAVGRPVDIIIPEPQRARPLPFREWWPGMRMTPGVWGIPAPAEGDWVLPEVLLVPLLGFDGSGYRLGYGGGYYDRMRRAAGPPRPGREGDER